MCPKNLLTLFVKIDKITIDQTVEVGKNEENI
jgi:hypothetical protein